MQPIVCHLRARRRSAVRRPPGAALLALIMVSALSHCKALFYEPREAYLNPAWLDASTFVEVRMRYRTRMSWNPLNQNSISRDYHSTVFAHRVDARGQVVESRELGDYPGWSLEGSVFGAGERVVLLRGTDDTLGGARRDVLLLSRAGANPGGTDSPSGTGAVLPVKNYVLAAIPAPSGTVLAVFATASTMEERRGELFVDFYDLSVAAPRHLRHAVVPWEGDPGLPDLAWSRDSARVYVRRFTDVAAVAVSAGTAEVAREFPRCFLSTSSGAGISPGGLRLTRDTSGAGEAPESGRGGTETPAVFRVEQVEGWVPFEHVEVIRDFGKIGYGCPA